MTLPDRARRRPLAFIACCAMSVGGFAFARDELAGSTGFGDERRARFEFVTPCPFPTGSVAESRVSCGFLEVPENRSRRAGPRARIPVARVRSANPLANADPVVFLHGGPGAAPLESPGTVERFSQHPFAAQRDIVLFNQRGSAQTDPALSCDALRAGRIDIHAANLTLAERDARIAEAAARCLREIAAQGRDLASYGAAAAAADLGDLRRALGIERWNLLAVSYGTLIALEAARIDPVGVRSLILDSVVSPQSDLFMSEGPRNFSLGLDRLLDSCAEDPVCAADFPDLARQLRELLDSLERRPLMVSIAGVAGQGSIDISVNWHDFLGVVHWMMYNVRTLRQVPLLIDRTRRGDLRVLSRVMDRVFPAPRNGPSGASPAFFAFVCRDQFTVDRPAATAPANPVYRGFSIVSFVDEVCASAVERPQARMLSLHSPVPALLLSGKYDPMTPDLYARQAAANLPRATLVMVNDSGHSTLSDFDACQTQLAVEFIDTLKPPVACTPSLRPAFVRSIDEMP